MLQNNARGALQFRFIVLLAAIMGVATSCGVTPSPTPQLPAPPSAAPSPQVSPTPGVSIETPTTRPSASHTQYPLVTDTPLSIPETATLRPRPSDLGSIIFFEVSAGIWKVNPANGESRELLYADDSCKGRPELSPDGEFVAHIAHDCGHQGTIDLWLLAVDDKVAWRVSVQAPQMEHNWLPNGQLLYTIYPSYVFDPYGDVPPYFGTDYVTFVYDPRAKTLTQVLALPLAKRYEVYAVSPTRDKVAAVRRGDEDLLMLELDGSDARTLIRSYSMETFVWSPDGQDLAYAQGADRAEIYILSVSSGRSRALTHGGALRGIIVKNWSPDGKWIAFDQVDVETRRCVVRVDSGEENCFDPPLNRLSDDPVAWSPDSSAIADSYRASVGDSWDIYIGHVADGKSTRLTHDKTWEYYVLWRR
jgi:Tol biopolymer transport system component